MVKLIVINGSFKESLNIFSLIIASCLISEPKLMNMLLLNFTNT